MVHSKKTLLCSSLIALMVSPAVYAQDSGETRFKLDEVTVTATRTETSLQETAVAVTALSGLQLQQSNVGNLQEAAAFVPSLSIGNRAGQGSSSGAVSLRGMGVDSFDSASAVGTYVDDVYYASDQGNILGLMDVERIEVLRGPQGTLFGRNTIAGAIQYVTVAPSDEFGGYIKGSTGSMNTHEVAGAVNVPVGDTFAVRVSGMYREGDGWVKDELNGGNLGDNESLALRLRARWQPTDALTADFKIEHVEQESEGVPILIDGFNNFSGFVFAANDFVNNFADLVPGDFPLIELDQSLISTDNLDPSEYSTGGINSPDFFDFSMDQYSLNLNYDISDNMSVKSITSYSEYQSEMERDIDGTPVPLLESTFPADDVEVFTQEVQLSGSLLDSKLDYTTGVYYYNKDKRSTPDVNIIGYPELFALLPASDAPGPKVTNESISVFGQATYNVSDALSLTAGYRYSDEEATTQQNQGLATSPVQKFNFKDYSPYFGADYKFNDDAMFYVKYSEGFRAGGRTANFLLPGGGADYDQETAATYEAGLRLDMLDGRLRFNPTIYSTDWDSVQFLYVQFIDVPGVGALPVIGTANAGNAKIQGLELEGQFAAHENFVLRGSYSYMDAEYTKVDSVFAGSLTLDTPLQRAPENKFSAGFTHTYDLDNGANVSTSADLSWVDEQKSLTLETSVNMPAVSLISGRVQYNAPNNAWNIAAYGKNLTNEFYLVGGTDYAAGGTAGVRQLDVGRPREVGVSGTFNF